MGNFISSNPIVYLVTVVIVVVVMILGFIFFFPKDDKKYNLDEDRQLILKHHAKARTDI